MKKEHTRHRSFVTPHFGLSQQGATHIQSFTWTPGTTPQWIPSGSAYYVNMRHVGAYKNSFMEDVVNGRTRWHDCVNLSTETAGYTLPYGPHDPTESDHVWFTNPGDLSSAVRYPISGIVQASQPYLKEPNYLQVANSVFSNPRIPYPVFDLTKRRDPFQTEFSAWYLLTDLVDIRRLASGVFDKRRLILRVRSDSAAKQLANDTLMVQYGIIPTVRDLEEFTTQLKHWSEKYEAVASKLNDDFTFPLTEREGIDIRDFVQFQPKAHDFIVALPQTGTNVHIYMNYKVVAATWHANGLCHWTCPEFRSWLDRVKAFVDQFGLLDPTAIWDIIPWSFVVDWFFGVGNWIHGLKPILMPATLNVKDYAESVRLEIRRIYSMEASWIDPTDLTVQHPPVVTRFLASETTTVFVRRRFRPKPVMVKKSSKGRPLVTVKRLIIASSLLVQRVPRIFHRHKSPMEWEIDPDVNPGLRE